MHNNQMAENVESNKGFTGLMNLGNTCFLNSCVQVLSHTYELTEFMESKKYKDHLKDRTENIIINEWNDLRSVMWSKNGVVSPKRFVHHVQQIAMQKDRELFTGYAQNDLPEFLLFLIECMHNSISRGVKMNIRGKTQNKVDNLAVSCYKMLQTTYSKEYSEIMEMFYGIYVSELVSLENNKVLSYNPENYFILDLEIPSPNASIYDCFESFTSYETLEGDNAWFNSTTGKKENVKKRITFWSLPKVLIITFKRFSYDGTRKRQDLIDFPIDGLTLSNYVSGYNAKQYVYDLYGICNHMGGPMGGHYNAFVRTCNNSWNLFDDAKVTKNISEKKIVTPKAYCLFYRKR